MLICVVGFFGRGVFSVFFMYLVVVVYFYLGGVVWFIDVDWIGWEVEVGIVG